MKKEPLNLPSMDDFFIIKKLGTGSYSDVY